MTMKVFVINLADSSERRMFMSEQLEQQQIDFEFFDAIDGRKDHHPLFNRYDKKSIDKVVQATLSGGELGCWASHFLLWQKCIDLNTPIIVMEDDVVIQNFFKDALSCCEKLAHKYPYIRLARIWESPSSPVTEYNSFTLIRFLKGVSGTQCYMITPKAAKTFIQHSGSWPRAIDTYMDRYWEHGINNYALTPFAICLAELESEIPRKTKQKLSLRQKIRREFVRISDRVARRKYNRNQ